MVAMEIVAIINNKNPAEAGDDAEAREFAESQFGRYSEVDWLDSEFVAGFVAAALNVWKRTRQHI